MARFSKPGDWTAEYRCRVRQRGKCMCFVVVDRGVDIISAMISPGPSGWYRVRLHKPAPPLDSPFPLPQHRAP